MDKLRPYLLPLLAAIVYLAWRLFGPSSQPAPSPAPSSGPVATPDTANEPARDRAESAAGRARRAPRTADPQARQIRDAMLANIRVALHSAQPVPSSGPRSDERARATVAEAGEIPALDAAYIQTRFREDMLPLARECYESALEHTPDLRGNLLLKFSIVGDPAVGGVVENAEIARESELQDPDFWECMRESLFTLTFVAPENGGRLEVSYPVEFAPEDPE